MYRAGRDLGPDTPAGFKPGGDGVGPIYTVRPRCRFTHTHHAPRIFHRLHHASKI